MIGEGFSPAISQLAVDVGTVGRLSKWMHFATQKSSGLWDQNCNILREKVASVKQVL